METASGFEEPLVWSRVPILPTLIDMYDTQGYYHSSDWILTNQVTVPAAYYRIRLLDP